MRSTAFFILWLFLLRLYRFEHFLDKARLRYRAYDFNAVVYYGLGDALHAVALGDINELGNLDHIGSDMLVFNG